MSIEPIMQDIAKITGYTLLPVCCVALMGLGLRALMEVGEASLEKKITQRKGLVQMTPYGPVVYVDDVLHEA